MVSEDARKYLIGAAGGVVLVVAVLGVGLSTYPLFRLRQLLVPLLQRVTLEKPVRTGHMVDTCAGTS